MTFRERLVVQTHDVDWRLDSPGVERKPLDELTCLARLDPGTDLPLQDANGVENPAGCWLRSPHLSQHHPFVEEETVILVNVGHLA